MNGLFNSVASNETITSQDFLDVYNWTNKIFADVELFANAEFSINNKDTFRYGWGNNKIILPEKIITAIDWNQVITRCNLIISHTNINYPFINRVPRKTQISYQKLTDIQNVLNLANDLVQEFTIFPLKRFNYLNSTYSNVTYLQNIIKSDTWYDEIDTIIQYEQSAYNDIRYYFNGGNNYEYTLNTANECGPGMGAIVDIVQDLGTLIFDITNFRDTNGTGVTTNKNYLDLNNTEWTLLWTSNAGYPSSYSGYSGYSGYCGYGGYSGYSGNHNGYSGYSSSRITVYGRLTSLYESVLIKFVFLSTIATLVEGVIEIDLFLKHNVNIKRYGITDHQTLPNINIINTL